MLTGNLVRLKFHRDRVLPQYLDTGDPQWLDAAGDLLAVFRNAKLKTRSEVELLVQEIVGETNAALIPQGLAKLLDDRCEYETIASRPPEEVREVAFRQSAIHRAAMAEVGQRFDRDEVIKKTAAELGLPADELEGLLFADLKDEQRIQSFQDISAEHLLHRYNVALAQAVLLRSVGLVVRVNNPSPARMRQLFRALRFRRLIAAVRPFANNGFELCIDGPLSLFSATQKYSLQLALFLPTLLHCESFTLEAELRWGPERKPKIFQLSSEEGLQSHTADYGVYTPKEYEFLKENFANASSDWVLHDEPVPIPVGDTLWVPDFSLTHTPTGKMVFLEMFGYWRRVDLAKHLQKLRQHLPNRYLIAVSEQYRVDDEEEAPTGVIVYKRLPTVTAIVQAANGMIGK